MARKRMIDPEIWTDEKILELSWDAVPFYVGLVSQADDEGRFRYSAASLRAKICPRDGITVAQVEAWMWECVAVGLVLVYEAEGAVFGILPGWSDYQKVQHPTPSRIPEPPANIREESSRLLELSRNFVSPQKSSPQVRLDRLDRSGKEGRRDAKPRPRVSEDDLPRFGELEPDVVAYVVNAGAKNDSGRITIGKELGMRNELLALAERIGNRDAFAYGLRAANSAGAANAKYVERAASGYDSKVTRMPQRPAAGFGIANRV